ncbi:MAG: CDP-glycerol glycerophosphotransferase family protein [Micropruina sp.]|uniref:CDP-glycerol glycerophosphotransferase family protein n=1 Tax=Micropruina sp. TaxID=2737536 RepID=UPI0039E3589B
MNLSGVLRPKVLEALLAVVCNTLGVITILAAIVAPTWVGTHILMWVLVIAVLCGPIQELWEPVRSGGALPLVMGTMSFARIDVLLAALVVDYYGRGVTLGVAGVTLASLSILAEQVTRPLIRRAVPVVSGISGWEVPVPSLRLANLLYLVNLLAIVTATLSSTFDFSQAWLLLLVAVSAVLTFVLLVQVGRYYLQRSRFERNLPAIMSQLAPAFAFHWHAPAGTAYQASMWLPYLARLGTPYFVLVRTAANFEEIVRLTDAPVIMRAALTDLDDVIPSSLRVVFYVNTAVRNSHMIRFPHLTHIQLNHGDSDKITSVSPTFRQYTRNFVAGQAAIDRFAKHGVEVHPDQFVIVGRPQLEGMTIATRPIAAIAAPTVLYSPTWSGFYEDSDYSSLRAGPEIVRWLLDRGCTVVFRPHPYARRHVANANACDQVIAMLAEDAKANGRQHVFGPAAETTMSVVDCFNAADAMVSDVSSVVSDFLFSGKPFAMAAVSTHGQAFRDEFPLSAAAYVFEVFRDGHTTSLEAALGDMLGADTLAPTRQRLRTYYLSDADPEHYAERFLSAARGFLVEDATTPAGDPRS